MNELIISEVDGVRILNTTPHPISFQSQSGEKVELPLSGLLVNATSVETVAQQLPNGVSFVTTKFTSNSETYDFLMRFKQANPDVVIVGSLIAAQAYPGLVVAMTPAQGYERVAPADKRMNPHKFTIFE